jgi:site-specific recombinase XerC
MKPKHDWLWAYDIGRRMGDVGTRQMFSQIKAIAGLTDAKHTQPHAIRRGYATRRLEAGMPLKALQASLGHSMAETTLLYTQANEKAAKAMHDYAILQATPAPLTPLPSAPAHGGKSKPSRSASVMAVRRRLPSTTGGR